MTTALIVSESITERTLRIWYGKPHASPQGKCLRQKLKKQARKSDVKTELFCPQAGRTRFQSSAFPCVMSDDSMCDLSQRILNLTSLSARGWPYQARAARLKHIPQQIDRFAQLRAMGTEQIQRRQLAQQLRHQQFQAPCVHIGGHIQP